MSLFSFRSTTSVKIARLGLTIVKTQQSLTSKNMTIDEKKSQVIIYSGDLLMGCFRCQADGTFNVPKDPFSWPVCRHIVRAPDPSGPSSAEFSPFDD